MDNEIEDGKVNNNVGTTTCRISQPEHGRGIPRVHLPADSVRCSLSRALGSTLVYTRFALGSPRQKAAKSEERV